MALSVSRERRDTMNGLICITRVGDATNGLITTPQETENTKPQETEKSKPQDGAWDRMRNNS